MLLQILSGDSVSRLQLVTSIEHKPYVSRVYAACQEIGFWNHWTAYSSWAYILTLHRTVLIAASYELRWNMVDTSSFYTKYKTPITTFKALDRSWISITAVILLATSIFGLEKLVRGFIDLCKWHIWQYDQYCHMPTKDVRFGQISILIPQKKTRDYKLISNWISYCYFSGCIWKLCPCRNAFKSSTYLTSVPFLELGKCNILIIPTTSFCPLYRLWLLTSLRVMSNFHQLVD